MENLALSLSLIHSGIPHAHCVLVRKSGSAPQSAGARLLVQRDGVMHGTIGGGCVEMEVRRLALSALRHGKPYLRVFRLDDDYGYDDGLICGGECGCTSSPTWRSGWSLCKPPSSCRSGQNGARGCW
ncbi:MAG: XdhC family protein [Armatimonadota bacterium]